MWGIFRGLFSISAKLDTERLTSLTMRYCQRKGHRITLRNIYLHRMYEADVLSVKGSRIHEYEIKRTRADFQADLRKRKHRLMRKGKYPVNRFYYVCPDGLISKKELPEYAGLIYVNPYGSVRMQREARSIQKKPLLPRYIHRITDKVYERYARIRD
jgi:hypothetical protein